MKTAQRSPVVHALFPLLLWMLPLAARGQVYNEILSVSPASASAGSVGVTVTFTLDTDVPPPPPAGVLPDRVTLGSIAGTSVTHADQAIVTATFAIPSGQATGQLDAAVAFTTPNGQLAFTKTAAFTVTDSGGGAGEPPYPGYTLFAPLGETNTYLIDTNGVVVHTWPSAYRPGLSAYLLEDGTLLRTANPGGTNFNAGGAGGRIERIDWDGNVLWAYDLNTPEARLHHDIEPLPNGHLLAIAWEKKTAAEATAAGRDPGLVTDGELWPDTVIEIAPTGSYGGEIVWTWKVWDHLIQDVSPTSANYGVIADHPEKIDLNFTLNGGADWTHINAVDYREDLDQVLLTVHQFGEVWVIDHANPEGGLLYRWGNPQAYGAGDASDQRLFVPHDGQWIADGLPGAGHVLVFNNGQGRIDGNWSSVDEFAPPLAEDGSYSNGLPHAPESAAWTYAADPVTAFYAQNISGAQRLPNGHTLICNGPTGIVFEITTNGEVAWQYNAGGAVFRATRYATDYSGLANLFPSAPTGLPGGYPVVDTGQTGTYDETGAMTPPAPGSAYAGQDGQYTGLTPNYTVSGDGLTVLDTRTGLTWTRSPDLNDDGTIDADDKLTQTGAVAYAEVLNAATFGGFDDWRLPTIKELYSLMNFSGVDISGPNPTVYIPFIDTAAFEFGYGDTNAGEREIDAQFATTTIYLDTVMTGQEAMFGLNLADGRIKGYPTSGKKYYVYYIRGDTTYGANLFVDLGDGTVADLATGLQWQQADSGVGMTWSNALAYAESLDLGGYRDWRLPDAKELQSLLDYTRAPGATGSAAIDPVFACTAITNERGELDFPWYWSSTTHLTISPVEPAAEAVYVCFGRALGYFNGSWQDVHGAGCQRSDPKGGSLADWTYVVDGYYSSQAPQGDAIRIFNFVRCVRGGDKTPPATDTDGDGLSDWTEYNYATNTTAMSATGDLDGDGVPNLDEERAGTSPIDLLSYLAIDETAIDAGVTTITWASVAGKTYRIETATDLASADYTPIATALPATPPVNEYTLPAATNNATIAYRIAVEE